MIDRAWLEQWIQPRHLEADAVDTYSEAFKAHPARLLSVEDCLPEGVADSVYRFLAREAEYTTSYGLFTARGSVSEQEWRRSADVERFFKFRKLAGVRPEFRLSRHLVSFMKLRRALIDPRFKGYLERLTGMRLGSCSQPYAHAYGSGDYLRRHDDDFDDRCLTLVLYLSKRWRPELGGAFHMVGGNGNEARLEAGYNTLVLFDVTAKTEHFIAPISPAAEALRLSIGCWYHRPS